MSTAVFAGAELFYFVAPMLLKDASYLKAFTSAQRETLSMLSLRAYGYGGGIFMVFYGIASILREEREIPAHGREQQVKDPRQADVAYRFDEIAGEARALR